jgi:nicotinamidase-related amidase
MITVFGREIRDTLEEMLDPTITALLVIDMQLGGVSTEGAMGSAGHDVSMFPDAIAGCARALEAARRNGVPVVHVRVANLPDGDSSPAPWLHTLQVQSNGPCDLTKLSIEGDAATDFVEQCRPLAAEVVVTKRRPSAFFGTDLAMILRAKGIDTVAIAGISTSICVQASLHDATHHDFYAVLLEDATGDYERDIHEATMKVIRARNDVASVSEAAAIWDQASVRAFQAAAAATSS